MMVMVVNGSRSLPHRFQGSAHFVAAAGPEMIRASGLPVGPWGQVPGPSERRANMCSIYEYTHMHIIYVYTYTHNITYIHTYIYIHMNSYV